MARRFAALLLANEIVGPDLFVLRFADCAPLLGGEPGQFVMLRGPWGTDPLLPRAFSILRTTPAGELELLVKAMGKATRRLAAARPGERYDVLGPLGSHFPALQSDERCLLVAGGVGLAPLLFFLDRAEGASARGPALPGRDASSTAERQASVGRGAKVRLLYGGRTRADLVLGERIAATGVACVRATEDGSEGEPGYVTDVLARELASASPVPMVFACGPEAMLVEVARLARAAGAKAWLSLEGEMACGIGVCLGCAVPCQSRPFRYACVDGPVLPLDDLRGPYA